MKKITFLLTCLLGHTLLFGQASSGHDAIMAVFKRQYNSNSGDSIFMSFSSEMQVALPLEKAKQFLSTLKTQIGAIQQTEMMNNNGSVAMYKTTFERAQMIIHLSLSKESRISGLFIKPFVDTTIPVMDRNATKLRLPFKDEWTVFWGGDTKEQNYHVEYRAQKNAFDMIIMDDNGKSFKTNGATNEDYYAFAKELLAPCEAEVVIVVDGVKDNKPGEMNPVDVTGNTVVMRTVNNEYLIFAHFKKNSIAVSEGQKVKQGQLLGLCGNSGNSSEPHLHFHIQNSKEMASSTGIKCYFERLLVNGKVMSDYSPVKGDRIKIE